MNSQTIQFQSRSPSFFDFDPTPIESTEELIALPITELESMDQYQTRFARINENSSRVDCSTAELFINTPKNRYPDVVPSDEAKYQFENPAYCSYINASWYDKEAILTQGPLCTTKTDFWLMVFESNGIIICVTDERGLKKNNIVEKTANYWDTASTIVPTEIGLCGNSVDEIAFTEILSDYAIDHEFVSGKSFCPFKVKPLGNPVVLHAHGSEEIISSQFEVSLGEVKKIIPRLYFKNWPDNGICTSKLLAKFIRAFPQDLIPIIHCSAGIGRSGVVAIAHHFIDAYKKYKTIPTEDQIDEEIIKLRKARPGVVQTYEQRRLITEVILEYISLKSKGNENNQEMQRNF